jgi:endonuclease YncB( thermonuclease family)
VQIIPIAHLSRLIGLVLVALLVVGAPASAQDAALGPPEDGERAFVIDVTDGDTIKVERENGVIERLRYIGIDTPETVHPDEPIEPWGPEASAANAELVDGRWVILERDISDRDRFDRLLRYVWIETAEGPVMVNDALVGLGLAEVKAYEPDTKYHEQFLRTQARAIEMGVGMHVRAADNDGAMEPAALSLQLIDAYNRRDVVGLSALLAPDVNYTTPGAETVRGLDGAVAALDADWATNGGFMTPRDFVRQEGTVVAEMEIGPPRRSQGPSTAAILVMRWVDGLLDEYRLYQDATTDS